MKVFARIAGLIVWLVALFFPVYVSAQTCGGSGFVCHYGPLECPVEEDPVTGCPVPLEYRYQSNEGCGTYPDCNILPDRQGCQLWTGTCYNQNPPSPVPSPTPTFDPSPDPTFTPPPGYTCNGSCEYYTCNIVGMNNGSGTCPPETPNCCTGSSANDPSDGCNCCSDDSWPYNQFGHACSTDDEWTAGYYAAVNHACNACSGGSNPPPAEPDCSAPLRPSFTVNLDGGGERYQLLGETIAPQSDGQYRLRWTDAGSQTNYYQLQILAASNPAGSDMFSVSRTITNPINRTEEMAFRGGAFSSPYRSGYGPRQAFTGATSGSWRTTATGADIANHDYIGYDFGLATYGRTEFRPIKSIQLTQGGSVSRRVDSVLLQVSEDMSGWENVQEFTGLAANQTTMLEVNPPHLARRYFRLVATSSPTEMWVVQNILVELDGPNISFNAQAGQRVTYTINYPTRSRRLTRFNDSYGYTARVRGVNNSCGSDIYGSWSQWVSYYWPQTLTGQVIYNPNGDATVNLMTNMCSGSAASIDYDFSVYQVHVRSIVTGETTTSAVNPDGTYSIDVPGSAINGYVEITLVPPGDSPYECACPGSCSYTLDTSTLEGSPVDFYVSSVTDPWWQVEGGSVAAFANSGLALASYIPTRCAEDPNCTPYLIKNLNGQDSDGVVVTGGGEIDTAFEVGRQANHIDESLRNWLARLTRNTIPRRQGFGYFQRVLYLSSRSRSDFGLNLEGEFANETVYANKPEDEPVNTSSIAYFHRGDFHTAEEWNVGNDEVVIVLVEGDIFIGHETHAEPGGFLMFVSSGNITFDPNLGHVDPSDNSAVVEGIFVADQEIRIPSRGADNGGDLKFVGEGTFVGWERVVIDRNYADNGLRDDYNHTYPVEVFRYRPDLAANTPNELKRTRYTWLEVKP